ncbi:MAG: HPF/RaiA family ribosome-associated protein [Planctomycetota bacterium]
MRIEVHTRGLGDPRAARERTRRSLLFALGRFAPEVRRVTATVEDLDGPRGGADKRCRLRAVLRAGGEPLVSEDVDAQLHAAIDTAAERLGRAVARRLDRRR